MTLNANDSDFETQAADGEIPSKLWSMPSYLLNRISHRYSKSTRDALKSKGLTTLNARIIVALNLYGELTVNELCVHAIAEQPAMSRALDRLEADGYVTRTTSAADSRVRIVQPLQPAKALFDEVFPVLQRANQDLLSVLSATERQQLMSLLSKVLTSIRKNQV